MATEPRQSFDHLSPQEREVVGEPADYDWDNAIELPARRRKSETAQFSLRVDRDIQDAMARLAQERGMTFSEAARDALRAYVGRRPRTLFLELSAGTGSASVVRSRFVRVRANRLAPGAPAGTNEPAAGPSVQTATPEATTP